MKGCNRTAEHAAATRSGRRVCCAHLVLAGSTVRHASVLAGRAGDDGGV